MVMVYSVKCSSPWDRFPQRSAVTTTVDTSLPPWVRGDPLSPLDEYRNRFTQAVLVGDLA